MAYMIPNVEKNVYSFSHNVHYLHWLLILYSNVLNGWQEKREETAKRRRNFQIYRWKCRNCSMPELKWIEKDLTSNVIVSMTQSFIIYIIFESLVFRFNMAHWKCWYLSHWAVSNQKTFPNPIVDMPHFSGIRNYIHKTTTSKP